MSYPRWHTSLIAFAMISVGACSDSVLDVAPRESADLEGVADGMVEATSHGILGRAHRGTTIIMTTAVGRAILVREVCKFPVVRLRYTVLKT